MTDAAATPPPSPPPTSGGGAGGELSISYELTLDDLVAVCKHAEGPTRSKKVWNFIKMSTVLPLVCLLAFVSGYPAVGTVVTLVSCLLLYSLFPRSVRKRLLAYCQKDPYILGNRRIRIAARGLTLETSHVQVAYRWHMIKKIETDTEYAFVHLRVNEVLPLPRRAFADGTGFEVFLAGIYQYVTLLEQPPRELR